MVPDALAQVLSVNPNLAVFRARYSAFTKIEIETAFNNLVDLDYNLAAVACDDIVSGVPC